MKALLRPTTNTGLWLILIAFTLFVSITIFVVEKQTLGDVASNYFNPSIGSRHVEKNAQNPYRLTPESVVLITGAAGFLGSQLALALYRTFGVTNLICIDNLSTHYLDVSDESKLDSDELSQFEFKRQRMNYILQTVPSAEFYVADFRPSLPEFFEVGEIPLLNTIFQKHSNITHVVHFADSQQYWSPKGVAVPHVSGDTKTGMIEVLLEQLKKTKNEWSKMPHFTYASSYEVYKPKKLSDVNKTNMFVRETDVLSTPGSLHGASKLIDEILAASYYSIDEIFSVALRFFPIYGPWSCPGSPLFEMAERALASNSTSIVDHDELLKPNPNDLIDYVYIDDAVDAIMSAMQFWQKGAPAAFNIGTGEPITLNQIANIMRPQLSRSQQGMIDDGNRKNTAIHYSASIEEAKKKLNWEPRISLETGLSKLLGWHWDRNHPYDMNEIDKSFGSDKISGILGCNPYDNECLNGHTIFPCISECSNPSLCIPSHYDEAAKLSRKLTDGCDIVLYTVVLDPDASDIPSGRTSGGYNSTSYVKSSKGSCNIAFISENSVLWRRTRKSSQSFGFWRLLPVPLSDETHPEAFLPKYSPGKFFANSVNIVIYSSPNIVMKDIKMLASKVSTPPGGLTSLTRTLSVMPKRLEDKSHIPKMFRRHERAQESAYNKIKLVVKGRRFRKEREASSNWIAHALRSQAARSFRCDVYGENLRWDVNQDENSLNFVLMLHDIWSRMIQKWSSETPWWIKNDKDDKSSFYVSVISSGDDDSIVIIENSDIYTISADSGIDDDFPL